jgi:hypothetical protein
MPWKHLTYCHLASCGLLFFVTMSLAAEPERNPFIEAINLVWATRHAEIRAVDKGAWWFDTSKREWSVQRPFGPGVIDSTHLFEVTYKIDGKKVMSWEVDIQKKKVDKR